MSAEFMAAYPRDTLFVVYCAAPTAMVSTAPPCAWPGWASR